MCDMLYGMSLRPDIWEDNNSIYLQIGKKINSTLDISLS